MFFSEHPEELVKELIDMLAEKRQKKNEAQGWVPSNPYGNAKLLEEQEIEGIGTVLFDQMMSKVDSYVIYRNLDLINQCAQAAGTPEIEPFVPSSWQGWNRVVQYCDKECSAAMNMHYQVHQEEFDAWIEPVRACEQQQQQGLSTEGSAESSISVQDILTLHLYNKPDAWNEWTKKTVFGSGNVQAIKINAKAAIATFMTSDSGNIADAKFVIPFPKENINCDLLCTFLIMPSNIYYCMFTPSEAFTMYNSVISDFVNGEGVLGVEIDAEQVQEEPLNEEQFLADFMAKCESLSQLQGQANNG